MNKTVICILMFSLLLPSLTLAAASAERVKPVTPENVTAWDGVTGCTSTTHWDCVNDDPTDDASSTYVSCVANAVMVDLYNTNATFNSATHDIRNVTLYTRVCAVTNKGVQFTPCVQVSGTQYCEGVGDVLAVCPTYETNEWFMDNSPATGSEWTAEEADTMLIGAQGGADCNPDIYMTQVYATVGWENVNQKPAWSNNQTNPASGTQYSPGSNYQFNITWSDSNGVSDVVLQFNNTNYSFKAGQVTNFSNVYHKTFTDLPANTSGWQYKWYANDTLNAWNNTSTLSYVIAKNTSAYMFLYLNGTQGNVSYSRSQVANFTAWLNVSGRTIYLASNYTGWGSDKSDSNSRIENTTTLSTTGNWWNMTAWWVGVNYTSNNNVTYFFNVTPVNVTWNQSTLTLGIIDIGDVPLKASVKNVTVNSTGSNTNVNIYTISNPASSFLTITPTSIGSMSDQQTQQIRLNCSPSAVETPGYYEATFKVNSTEDPTGASITVDCSVQGPPQYSMISVNVSEPVEPESVIEHVVYWGMQNNIGTLSHYWFEWNATNNTPDGLCGEAGFQNVTDDNFIASPTSAWANVTKQLPLQCNDTYIEWHEYANGSTTKTAAQGYAVDKYGWFNVTLDTPTPGQITNINRYDTFWMNATITCIGPPTRPCGSTSATARRNSTGTEPDTTISTTTGDPPFWTPDSNPFSCGPGQMYGGSTCKANWTVNATGNADTYWAVDVRATTSPPKAPPNDSSNAFIKIIENQAPQWLDNLTSIASGSVYNPSNNYGFSIIWQDPENGIGGISQGLFFTNLSGSNITYNKTSTPAVNNNTAGIYWINFTSIGAGTYFFQWKANDTSNKFNSSDTWIYTIAKNSTNPVDIWLNNGTEYQNQNITVTYPTSTNITAKLVNGQSGTLKIYRNSSPSSGFDTDITTQNNTLVQRAAAYYEIKFNVTGNANYSDNATGTNHSINNLKADNLVDLFLNGTQNTNKIYFYPEAVNATGNSSNSQSDITVKLYRNGSLVDSGTPKAEEDILLGNSTYEYKVNASAGQNYSVNDTGLSFYALVNKGATTMTLSLNDTDGNKSYSQNQVANFTAKLNVSGQTIYLNSSYSGWSEQSNSNSRIENFTTLSSTGNDFNLTAYFPGNANLTSSSKTHFFNVTVVIIKVVWNQSSMAMGTIISGQTQSQNATVDSTGSNTNINVTESSDQCNCFSATPLGPYSLGDGVSQQTQFSAAPQSGLTNGTTYQGTYLVNSTQNGTTDQITVSFVYRAENYWNQSTLSIGDVNQSLSSSKNATVNATGDTSSVIVSTVSGNGTFISATPTSIGNLNNGVTQEIKFTCSPSGSETLGYYERVFNVSSAENPGRSITVTCTVVLYDGVPRYRNVSSNVTEIVPGDPILLYGEGYDALGLWQGILSTNETDSWQNFTGGGGGTQITIYNYSDTTNNKAYNNTTNTQTMGMQSNPYLYTYEYATGNYSNINANDSNKNVWDGINNCGVYCYGYVELVYKFKINEAAASINELNVTWWGYDNEDYNHSLYYWNFTSESWTTILTHNGSALGESSDSEHKKIFSSDFSDIINTSDQVLFIGFEGGAKTSGGVPPPDTPYIYSYNGSDYIFEKEIMHGLKNNYGTTYDTLYYLKEPKIKISSLEENEIDYIDSLKLRITDSSPFFTFVRYLEPISASNGKLTLIKPTDKNYLISNYGDSVYIEFEQLPPLVKGFERKIEIVASGFYTVKEHNTAYENFVKVDVKYTSSGSSLYGSPATMNNQSGAYNWSNFTWQNASIINKTVGWKIYYRDNASQYNVTSENTFWSGGALKDELNGPCPTNKNNARDNCHSNVLENTEFALTVRYTDSPSSTSAYNGTIHLRYNESISPRIDDASTQIPQTSSCTGNTLIVKSTNINTCSGFTTCDVAGNGDVNFYNLTQGVNHEINVTFTLQACTNTSGKTYDIDAALLGTTTGHIITDSYLVLHVRPKPFWNKTITAELWSSPALANVNGDNTIDVIVGDLVGTIHAYDGNNSTEVWNTSTGGEIWSSPTIADVWSNGTSYIAIGNGNNVSLINGNTGSIVWNKTTGDLVASTPAFYDADNNGVLDVIIGSSDNSVYALNSSNGNVIWSHATGGSIWTSSPIISDVVGSSTPEVIIGSYDASMYVLNMTNGDEVWSKSVSDANAYMSGGIGGSATVADINNDDVEEIVFGSYNGTLFALKGNNGDPLWTFSPGSWIMSSPIAAHLFNDSTWQIVFGTHSPDGRVYALNGANGTQIWNQSVGGHADSSPTVLDVNGDGYKDVVTGSSNWSVYAFDGTTGNIMWLYNANNYIFGSPAVSDLNADGHPEIVATTTEGKRIVTIDPPGEWNAFGGGELRTGTYDNTPPQYSKQGYKLTSSGLFLYSFWKDALSNLVKAEIRENSTGEWRTVEIDLKGVSAWINYTINRLEKNKTLSFSITVIDDHGNKNTYSGSYSSSTTIGQTTAPVCGNDICESGENTQSCPHDCPTGTTPSIPLIPSTPFFDLLPLIIGVILVAFIIIAFAVL